MEGPSCRQEEFIAEESEVDADRLETMQNPMFLYSETELPASPSITIEGSMSFSSTEGVRKSPFVGDVDERSKASASEQVSAAAEVTRFLEMHPLGMLPKMDDGGDSDVDLIDLLDGDHQADDGPVENVNDVQQTAAAADATSSDLDLIDLLDGDHQVDDVLVENVTHVQQTAVGTAATSSWNQTSASENLADGEDDSDDLDLDALLDDDLEEAFGIDGASANEATAAEQENVIPSQCGEQEPNETIQVTTIEVDKEEPMGVTRAYTSVDAQDDALGESPNVKVTENTLNMFQLDLTDNPRDTKIGGKEANADDAQDDVQDDAHDESNRNTADTSVEEATTSELDALLDGDDDRDGRNDSMDPENAAFVDTTNTKSGIDYDDRNAQESNAVANGRNVEDGNDKRSLDSDALLDLNGAGKIDLPTITSGSNYDDMKTQQVDTLLTEVEGADCYDNVAENESSSAIPSGEREETDVTELPKVESESMDPATDDTDAKQSGEQTQNDTIEMPTIKVDEKPLVVETKDSDDLDLEALLDDDHETNSVDECDTNDEREVNMDKIKALDSQRREEQNEDTVETPRIECDEPSPDLIVKDEDNHHGNLDLDTLLDGDHEDANGYANKVTADEKTEVNIGSQQELSQGIDSTIVPEKASFNYLDALLDEEDDEANTTQQERLEIVSPKREDDLDLDLDALLDDDVDIAVEVTNQNHTNLTTSKSTQNVSTVIDSNTDAGIGKGLRRTLFQSPKKIHDAAANMRNWKKNVTEPERKPVNLNATSISASFSKSKETIVSTKDRMRDYSRDLTKRASDRMKKDSYSRTTGTNQKVGLSSPGFVSSVSKRSFISPTLNSMKRFGENAVERGKEMNTKPLWDYNQNMKGFQNYMKSTINFSTRVRDTQNIEHEKAELKKINAQKTMVNLTPWRNSAKPTPISISCDDKKGMVSPMPSPTSPNRSERTSPILAGTFSSIKRFATTKLLQKQKQEERELETKKCIVDLSSPDPTGNRLFFGSRSRRTPRGGPHPSPAFSYGETSIGSITSHCTIESFANPMKERIRGCQGQFDPFLHEIRGACELCVFRLPESEREKLDLQGRHLMVQFTTGGCADCSAFPKSVGEPHVRLCQRCYSSSHRPPGSRTRKKGTFAKIPGGKF
mmetsp:Transcript_13121/g.30617  ORF Transcript_13121/g.30617 Transcript_13121/m.30617 type:complete len:1146 (+) Transcript_13121:64-3501(+)|eukprot:CAMPEP_0172397030 /NCGR_PEP_ID=MMETSP1061-20121228/28575_1 /TAXON_ID=37318 /ORGANISM="Pseudo-nitzschia pungens, Strain cf. pungens" /LENGTH=1145 /DNA_ID=CAMNT_0013129077 /DNA_START=49 /DNA_END=3486 /DNA_ORIENTATION=+